MSGKESKTLFFLIALGITVIGITFATLAVAKLYCAYKQRQYSFTLKDRKLKGIGFLVFLSWLFILVSAFSLFDRLLALEICAVSFIVIVIAIVDVRLGIIGNESVLVLLVLALLNQLYYDQYKGLISAFLAVSIVVIVHVVGLVLARLLGKRDLWGLGDLKLSLVMSAYLGVRQLMWAFVCFSVLFVGYVLYCSVKRLLNKRHAFAVAPFFAISFIMTLLFSEVLSDAYQLFWMYLVVG